MTLLLWPTSPVFEPPPDPPTPPVTPPGDPITSDLPAPSYGVWAVVDGVKVAELVDAVVVECEYAESAPGRFKVLVPVDSVGLGLFARGDGRPAVGEPELHIYRDGAARPIFQGWPQVWEFEPVGRWVSVEGWDIPGRASYLVFGDDERANDLVNGDMEADLSSWQAYGDAVLTHITDSVRGSKAMRVHVPAGSSPAWASRHFVVPGLTERAVWYASAWVKVPEGERWPVEALELALFYDGEQVSRHWADLPADLPVGEWVRLEAPEMGVSPGHTSAELVVRLHCRPGSTIECDEAHLSRNDNTGAEAGSDVSEAVAAAVRYLSAKAGLRLGLRAVLSGEVLQAGWRWEHKDHPQGDRAWGDHAGTVSMRFHHPSRTVEVGPPSALGRHLGVDVGPLADSVRWTGERMATGAISLGEAGDVTREEAGARLDGEPLFEVVERAPKGGDLHDLDRRPAQVVAERGAPGEVVRARMPVPAGWRTPGDWIGLGARPCDRVGASVDAGPFTLRSEQKIVKLTLRPQDGDDLLVDLVGVSG